MIGGLILVLTVASLAAVVYFGFVAAKQDEAMRRLMEPETSFEVIRSFPFDPQQIDRLRGRVDRVGVLRTEEEVPTGRSQRLAVLFHIFIIDEFGEVRDVLKTEDREHASKTGYGLSNVWDIPLEDRDHLLDDRYEATSYVVPAPPSWDSIR